MPTQSLTSALLLLSNNPNGFPWTSPVWEARTKVRGCPWHVDRDAADDARSNNVPDWTVRTAKSVKTFAENAWRLRDDQQEAYIVKKVDNDSAGRLAWSSWVSGAQRTWALNTAIDDVLTARGTSPRQILRSFHTKKLPTADEAQIYMAQIDLGERLFGDDAFQGTSPILKPIVGKFVRTLLTIAWNRHRKASHREVMRMEKSVEAVREKWKAWSAEGAKPTIAQIKSFLRELRRLLALLTGYDDAESKAQVDAYVADMEAMLATANKESGTESSTKLPKAIRDALYQLASRDEIVAISREIAASLENIQATTFDERVEIDFDNSIGVGDWKEGVEELRNISTDSLWKMLGLPEKQLPFFQRWTDPDAMIDPWSEDGQAWLKDESSGRQPLTPRWHQLVGIYRMLERAFEGKPVLLMDGVGLGKTLQVLGTIACLAFYRESFKKHGTFPGQFVDHRFPSDDGNIPDLPHIIVCPVNLREQWEAEMKRFLSPSSFDILPYVGRLDKRSTWWTSLFSASNQPLPQRIILATLTAIQDDAVKIYTPGLKSQMGMPMKAARFERLSPSTVFGHEYMLFAADEAHSARKHNLAHMACRALREQTKVLVAMTATPVTTRPQDLYIMAQWMGLPNFDDYDEFTDLCRRVNKANREDSKAMREAGPEGSAIRGVLTGAYNKDMPELQAPAVYREIMTMMRERFATHVIRRTIDSVDFNAEPLFDLKPYKEHILALNMYAWEMAQLRSLAKDIVKENPIASADTRKHFYIEFRRSMLHPHMNPRGGDYWHRPESQQAWDNSPQKTIKLDVLAKTVKYHLEKNGQQPLTMDEDGHSLLPNSEHVADSTDYKECDRVVIFSAFPSSNAAIVDVLEVHGVRCVELNGSMTTKQRVLALKAFRISTQNQGPRVLILSNVGLVGLNLACANVMVIVDTTWSALDDEQLRGRIFRYPQKKQVHFYRLIALRTPDVFLNNISFGKGELHDAFVGNPPEFQNMFTGELTDNDDAVSLISLPTSSGEDLSAAPSKPTRDKVQPRPKPKPKARATAKSKARVDTSEENDGPVSDEDVAEPSGRNKGGKKKTRERPPQPPLKRSKDPASPNSPKIRKRTRKGTITQRDQEDSQALAEATATMQVTEHPTTPKAVDKGKKRDAIPQAPSIVPTSQVGEDIIMDDPVSPSAPSDPILSELNEPGGELSPDSYAVWKAAQDAEMSRSSPLTSPPGTSSDHDTIEEPDSVSRRVIAQSSSSSATANRGKSSREQRGGLLGVVHPGVLGKGKDGTSNRGKSIKTYATVNRKHRR